MNDEAKPGGGNAPVDGNVTLHDPSASSAPVRALPARCVAFVGLGLVGGSLALATRRAWPGVRIVGFDRPAIVEVAERTGVIDHGAALDDPLALLHDADLVVLCLPVLAIVDLLPRLRALPAGTVVTDTGSTKARVCSAADTAGLPRFIGGHPMAGRAHGGLAHADADLVRGAVWFLCPGERADPAAVALLRAWVRDLGARPVEIDSAEHDRKVALTSHLPHVVVNALAEAVLDGGALDAGGGSLRDLLVVAGAPIDVWGDTLVTNAPALRDALDDVIARLVEVRGSLDDDKALRERMRDLFARGRACRERLRV